MTYTLCTLPAVRPALEEMRRVLKPGGQLIFCEHGAAPDASVRRWQNRLNPMWQRMAGGCNLNRTVPELLVQGGFTIQELETGYIPGWKPASFIYRGIARPS
jgi:ubiquinone/menaquinone biosynthesis C-methylase UbiE